MHDDFNDICPADDLFELKLLQLIRQYFFVLNFVFYNQTKTYFGNFYHLFTNLDKIASFKHVEVSF